MGWTLTKLAVQIVAGYLGAHGAVQPAAVCSSGRPGLLTGRWCLTTVRPRPPADETPVCNLYSITTNQAAIIALFREVRAGCSGPCLSPPITIKFIAAIPARRFYAATFLLPLPRAKFPGRLGTAKSPGKRCVLKGLKLGCGDRI